MYNLMRQFNYKWLDVKEDIPTEILTQTDNNLEVCKWRNLCLI